MPQEMANKAKNRVKGDIEFNDLIPPMILEFFGLINVLGCDLYLLN